MKHFSQEQEVIRQYLLGLTPPEDSLAVEEQLLAGDGFYEELLSGEDELVDQYLRGELSEPERQRFTNHFLQAPERRQKLRFARVLRRYVALAAKAEARETTTAAALPAEAPRPARPPQSFSFLPFRSPVVSYGLLAAMLLMIGGISWNLFNNWRQQSSLPAGEVVAVALTPGLTRDSGETKRIAISPGIGILRLQLQIATADYASYRVVVLSNDRSEIWRRADLPAQALAGSRTVVADVPANSLGAGDYQIRLSGQAANGAFEDLATYQLRITR